MQETEDDTVAAYVRISTDDQDVQRQRDSITKQYNAEDVEWFVDIESGSNKNREQYQQLRGRIDEFDVITCTEIDRLGRSFAELADLVDEMREKRIDIDCVEQPVSTAGSDDDWMGDLMLNLMIVFADAERKMIKDRVQQGINRALDEGKHVGRPPFGFDVEDGFLVQVPDEYARAQKFINEVKKGREKTATAEFFEIPSSAVQSILKRSEENYDVKFDNDAWRVERAKVQSGEKELDELGGEE